jgi:hypothetical protein
MGIQIEFNPDLALRDYSEFVKGSRKEEECIPKNLEKDKTYNFLKKGQRVFWISDDPFWNNGEIPLCKTEGTGKLSRPIASIKILEATHFLKDEKIYTKGKYKVVEIFDVNNPKIQFEWMKKVK